MSAQWFWKVFALVGLAIGSYMFGRLHEQQAARRQSTGDGGKETR